MRIAIEAQRLFRPRKYGMDIVAYELLRRLPQFEDRHEYHLLVKDDKDKCISQKDTMFVHTVQALPYVLWEQALLPHYCNNMKADILHCTANTAPLYTKQPLVLTLHDIIFLESSYTGSKPSWYQRLGNIYRSSIVSFITKKATHVITVSEFQKKEISEKLSLPTEKISVIYNGVDDRFFTTHTKKEISSALMKYNVEQGYIFFMANTEPRKNITGVLQAYSLLVNQYPSAPRLLIKGLTKKNLQKFLKLLNEEHLMNHIDVINYVHYDDLPIIYQGASMLWFPSFSEGFGLPVIEAMASGIPVITSDTSCMPEIAGNAALLINPHEPQTITDAAITILSDPTTAKLLSRKGKERASFFSWDNAVTRLVQIYNEIEKTI